jgi:ATP-dependent helicase/nuclease subunit A
MRRYPNIVIRASAGTGKTFQLANRYIGLLHAGAPPDQILATTFTRKAAGEILERVLLRLAEAAMSDASCRQLSDCLGDAGISRARCLSLLEHFAQHLHRVRICTLDSFFAQIAGSFGLELGLPPGWRIVEEMDDTRLRREALESILGSDTSQEVSRLMHLMTKGEAERSVTELLQTTVNQLYSLYLETDAAAWDCFPEPRLLSAERRTEVVRELELAELPEDSRFHKARQSNLEAARAEEWEEFIGRGLAAKVADGSLRYHNKPLPPEVIHACELLLNHARGVFLQQLRQQTSATYQLLAKFDADYQRRKRLARALRFEDVTHCLSRGPDWQQLDRLDFRLDAQVSHVLLDEFQDTSPEQWRVLQPIARRVTESEGQQSFYWQGGLQSFFCVGDAKQAIYGWRGGRSELFQALESQLPGLERQSLTLSFRSAPPVIETVNRVFANLSSHPHLETLADAVAAWSKQFETHATARTELSGFACLEVAPAADEGEYQPDVTLAAAARRVAELNRASPGHTIGVLARRNATVARLMFELKQLGVAASEEGGNPLTDSAAVLAVLALLTMADHPGDTVARFHVAQSPLGPIVGLLDWEATSQAEQVAAHVRADLVQKGYGATLRSCVSPLLARATSREQNRLRQLVDLAYVYDAHASLRPRDFVRFIEKKRIPDPSLANVRVMTIHQAKGLQFDMVVLTELETGLTGQPGACVVHQQDPTQPIDRVCMHRNLDIQALLPAELQQMFEASRNQDVTESLCVLYVAMTRAIPALHVYLSPAAANERNLPKSSAGILRSTLTDGRPLTPQSVPFSCGDPQWYQQAAPRQDAVASPAAPPAIVFAAGRPAAARRRTAPSQLEGGGQVALGDLWRMDNVAARARGTMIHAWFEQVQWLEDGRPSLETLRQVAADLPAADLSAAGLDVDELLHQFNALLDCPTIARILRRDAYRAILPALLKQDRGHYSVTHLRLEVHNERRFAVRVQGGLLSGTIDRLVLIKENDRVIAADIIDYKTDSVAADDPQKLQAAIEFYRPQQEAYRQAVASMFRIDPRQVSARLLLLGPKVVCEL